MNKFFREYFNSLKPWQQRLWRFWLIVVFPFAIYFGYQAYDAHQWVGQWKQYDREYETAVKAREEGRPRNIMMEQYWNARKYAIDSEHDRDRYATWSLLTLLSPLFASLLYKLGGWVWGRNKQNAKS